MKTISPTDLFNISSHCLEQYMNVFLCNDAQNTSYLSILSSESFQPISFTVGDRLRNEPYVYEAENDFNYWCNELITDQLQRISDSEGLRFRNAKEVASIIRCNLKYLLEHNVDGVKLQETIWNQEFIDVMRRVICFSITGNPNINLQTHRKFNELARRLVPAVIKRIQQEDFNLEGLLKLAIASGISGLDLKGSGAASSSFSDMGIPMAPYFNMPLGESIDDYYKKINERANGLRPVFHWERFIQEVCAEKKDVKIAWFMDDYLATLFDLFFIKNLLDQYPQIVLTVIPRNGIYGNDVSWSDVINFLTLDVFENLNLYEDNMRLTICKSGPTMGTVNLRKLSDKVVDIIEAADFVVIGGCRAHEMIQGGLNKPSFTYYVVCRETSERVSGYDARKTPLLFFYLSPGEYAFYGFKDSHLRTKCLADGRRIKLCRSTLEDHETRLKMSNPNDLVRELFNLQGELSTEPSEPGLKEANGVAEKLLDLTRETYDEICKAYTISRGKEPHELDRKDWGKLLDLARIRLKSGQLGCDDGFLTLLDVGTGSGRDIRYTSRFNDIRTIGIDNSDGFIGVLRNLEQKGEIPPGSFRKADMRDLSCFSDESFDIVRHNATLLHLPVLGKGYMADLALTESYRVLKHGGLLYVSVKEGDSLRYVDTKEGYGGRVFQFHTMKSIKELIVRNEFSIIDSWKKPSTRGEEIRWISVIAEKT